MTKEAGGVCIYTGLNSWVEQTWPPEKTFVSPGLTLCRCAACTDPLVGEVTAGASGERNWSLCEGARCRRLGPQDKGSRRADGGGLAVRGSCEQTEETSHSP